MALYRENDGIAKALLTAQDPLVQSLGPLYLTYYAMGDEESAAATQANFLQTLERLGPGFDLASALTWYAFTMLISRNYQTSVDYAARAIALCEEHGYVAFLGPATLTHALSRGHLSGSDEDVAIARAVLDQSRDAGYLHLYGLNLAELADVERKRGNLDTAATYASEALESVTVQGEGFWLPRIHEVIALTELERTEPDSALAESALSASRHHASEQGAAAFASAAESLLLDLRA